MRYYIYAVVGALLIAAVSILQWAVAYYEARPGTIPGATPGASALSWLALAFGLAVPVFIGWRRARDSAFAFSGRTSQPTGNAPAAGALFGALGAAGAGVLPVVVAAMTVPESLPWGTTTIGMTAPIVLFVLVPVAAAFCAVFAWIAETLFTRLAPKSMSP